MTYLNAQGESIASAPGILVNTNLHDAAQFTVPALSSLAGWIRGLASAYQPASVNVYEADVATGAAAPSSASFAQVGNFALGATVTVTTTAAGAAPPSSNTARVTPGGLQPPPTPTVERASGSGSFPAGRDVYVIATFTNAAGETLPSLAGTLIDTVLDDAIQVPIPSTLYQITGVNLYEADVATGAPPPATNTYALVGSFQPLTTATITATASGPPPPTANSSGAAGNIAPDAGTGLRYASIAFTNRNGNLSPTVTAFTSISVDVPGDQLYMANIPTGPANTLNRTIGFTVADGTNAGPFFYIPAATVSAGIPMTATVIGDNTTTTAFFNFTDEFLEAETSTDMTDRLRCVLPPAAVDVLLFALQRSRRAQRSGWIRIRPLHLAGRGLGVLLRRHQPHPGSQRQRTALHLRPRISGHALLPERALRLYHLPHGHRPLHLVGAAAVGRRRALRAARRLRHQ